jgi:hypothetical protein
MRNNIKPKHSRAIAQLKYTKGENTLTIQYLNGGRYIYAGVTPFVWSLVKGYGKDNGYGKAVNQIVKPNHNFIKVG